ncbi:hypothetical protein OIU85_018266 [Salix viminalis]|uniref:Uncharacterized protein n=1 Tax=Salix viminalis TaxID=40686 RepID=A0A9Q0UU08_SALVM|nr:hypothetical protein OIU85_018266 [Salix viminalis]
MDDPLLSRKIAEESSRRPGRELSPSYLDLGQSLRQSTSHLVTSDVIIPIITTPKTSSYMPGIPFQILLTPDLARNQFP